MKSRFLERLFIGKNNTTLILIVVTLFLTFLPSLINLFGIDLGRILIPFSPDIDRSVTFSEYTTLYDEYLSGRYIHLILVTIAITIAFLSVVLSFVDFGIQKDVSTPIMGVALFCAGCLDVIHLLVAGGWIQFAVGQEAQLITFTWFFSRMFHAFIITFGVSIFLIRISPSKNKEIEGLTRKSYVSYISIIFVLLATMTILFVFVNRIIPTQLFPGRFIPQPFELIPMGLYIIGLVFIFPIFIKKFPSTFSNMLFLSLIPAIFAQIHMAFGSHIIYDNHFFIAHYLKNLSYLIPFMGLALNYLQTHKNELRIIDELNNEAIEKEQTRKLLRGVLDSSSSGIIAFRRSSKNEDDNYKLVLANETALQILALDEKIVMGMDFRDLMLSMNLEKLHKQLSRVWISVDYEELEYEYSGIWLTVNAVKKYNEIVITFTDITKRKIAEQALLENKQKLEGVFNQSFQLMGIINLDGIIVELNQTGLDYFNLSYNEIHDKSLWNLPCWTGEALNANKIQKAVHTALKGEVVRMEIPVIDRDGLERVLDFSIKPVTDEKQEIVLLILEARDITDLKLALDNIEKSESRYRVLAGTLPDLAVLMFNKDFIYKLMEGQALSRIFNKNEVIPINKPVKEAFDPYPIEEWFDYHRQTLDGNSFQIEILLKDYFYKVYFIPLRNKEGEVYSGLIVFYDITVIKKYQTELEYSIEELNRSNQELEQFAYVASHDLQEPLRKIRTFGERLSDKYSNSLDGGAKEYIDRMQNASSRMQVLIDDLLSFSRISRTKPEWEKVDLNVVMQDIISDLELNVEKSEAKVYVAKMPTLEGSISQFRQLFQNLISNAVKFRKDEEPPVIKIGASLLQPDDKVKLKDHVIQITNNNYWHFTVSDNGIGFEMDYAEKIFTIFQRLHGRSQFEGTGIGLSVCKKIVEHHRGIIFAESKPGKGSVFHLILPEFQEGKGFKIT
ncbi:MAG: PAS domain-containing protein [Chitinophagaceae bacterium]|nr:MAG: PAS domain-containing protein [Chitinophagaceae bacterium]